MAGHVHGASGAGADAEAGLNAAVYQARIAVVAPGDSRRDRGQSGTSCCTYLFQSSHAHPVRGIINQECQVRQTSSHILGLSSHND